MPHWETVMKRIAPLVLSTLICTPAFSQETGWSYSATVYGWFSGLDSSVDTPVGEVETKLDFSDVWDKLDMAFFGSFEARHGRWGFIGDLIYSDLGSKEDTPFGTLFKEAEVQTALTLFTGYAVYRVSDTPQAQVDIGGGLRGNHLSIDVDLKGNLARDRSFSYSESWVDPVIAARVRVPFSERWFGAAFADLGGFGIGDSSDLTWQAFAGVGYRFNDTWSTQLGYRYLSIDKTLDGNDVELDLYGPLLGVTARF
jgi:opacity protein-like surface antigen